MLLEGNAEVIRIRITGLARNFIQLEGSAAEKLLGLADADPGQSITTKVSPVCCLNTVLK